jgi:rod shape-determining protein MreD
MRYIILAFLPLLSVFLQSTFFNHFSIKGSIPDLVLIFVVYHALFSGERQGTIYGMLCGLLEDLYMGRFIGVNVLAKGLTGYIMGKAQGNVFRENLLVGISAVVVGTLINSLAVVILLMINGSMLGAEVIYSILYQALYNLLLAAPLYLWYYYSTYNGWLRTTEEN